MENRYRNEIVIIIIVTQPVSHWFDVAGFDAVANISIRREPTCVKSVSCNSFGNSERYLEHDERNTLMRVCIGRTAY